ncbi:YetF domain-containing protein [Bizionia myxarmorum]|uniref:YetF domain-containing protein n=1 Tax=Bizionia myxarmorum TaxID=291186 RepID=UPI0037440378
MPKVVCLYWSKKSTRSKNNTSSSVEIRELGKLITNNFEIDEIELLILLRQAGIKYLSEVEHAYYEQSGALSVFKYDNPNLENSILPVHVDHLNLKDIY